MHGTDFGAVTAMTPLHQPSVRSWKPWIMENLTVGSCETYALLQCLIKWFLGFFPRQEFLIFIFAYHWWFMHLILIDTMCRKQIFPKENVVFISALVPPAPAQEDPPSAPWEWRSRKMHGCCPTEFQASYHQGLSLRQVIKSIRWSVSSLHTAQQLK